MHYLKREFVCERLRISQWSSYRLLEASHVHMIPSKDVITLLNRVRTNEPALDFIPSDLLSLEEAEVETGIPAKKLKSWTRRKRNPIPHYTITRSIVRVRRSSMNKWLEAR